MKVINLTTFQEVEHGTEDLNLGAEGYLLKAIHPKELISGIKHVQNDGIKYKEQILECLAIGLSNKHISEKLFLSEGTVKNYISSLYHKLDVKDRYQVA